MDGSPESLSSTGDHNDNPSSGLDVAADKERLLQKYNFGEVQPFREVRREKTWNLSVSATVENRAIALHRTGCATVMEFEIALRQPEAF